MPNNETVPVKVKKSPAKTPKVVAKATPKVKKNKAPAIPYRIEKPKWGDGKWSIYIPSKFVWSSSEQTPEALVQIYGDEPLNFKELKAQGYFKDGLPSRIKVIIKDDGPPELPI